MQRWRQRACSKHGDPDRSRLASRCHRGLGLAIVVLALVGVSPAAASAASGTLPPQGLYEACYPGQVPVQCDARVQQMGAAGFSLVLNYWMLAESTPQSILDYTNTAYASGVKTIWPLNEWWQSDPNGTNLLTSYSLLAQNCGCSTNAGLLAYVVGLAKNQPGTWGYYVADEPDPADAGQLANFIAEIKAVDPTHPVMIVALPGALQTYAGMGDVIGGDTYPVTDGPVNDPSAGTAEATATQQVQQAANGAGVKSAMVLQAWNLDDSVVQAPNVSGVTHFPTADEMTMMRNAAIANGNLSMILWWGMFDVEGYVPSEQPSYFLAPPDPASRWSSLVQAAFAPLPGETTAAPSAPATTTPNAPTATTEDVSATQGDPVAHAAGATHRTQKIKLAVRIRETRGGALVRVRGSDPGQRIVAYKWYVDGRRLAGSARTCVFRSSHRTAVVVKLVVTDAGGTSATGSRVVRTPAGDRV